MDTWSEAWRAATEARLVGSWDVERIKRYLAKVERVRSEEAAAILRAAVRKEWLSNQKAKS